MSPVLVDPRPRVDHGALRHHVVITGTGRAGTSFLVRFLGRCGLDVGSPSAFYDDRARAGLEHHLLDDDAPYVVKDPWLFAYCDRIDPQAIAIDALVVPVRELMAAAKSRILQERIAMAEGPWGEWPPSDVNAAVTAGAVYSLDPLDQARVLAVAFHRLIHWATARQMPLFLLEFPRAVNDGEYLIETLWPWLGAHCDIEQARVAFAAVADPQLVRIRGGNEDATASGRGSSADAGELDREAMAILLNERGALLAAAEEELTETRLVLGGTQGRLAEVEDALSRRDALVEEMRVRLDAMAAQLHDTTAEIDTLRRTLSWRLTRPLRRVRALGRAPLPK